MVADTVSDNDNCYQAIQDSLVQQQEEFYSTRLQQPQGGDPWRYHNTLYRQGPWSDAEHRAFEEAMIMYGRDYVKIQRVVKTRSAKQINQRIQNILRNKYSKEIVDRTKQALEAHRIKQRLPMNAVRLIENDFDEFLLSLQLIFINWKKIEEHLKQRGKKTIEPNF